MPEIVLTFLTVASTRLRVSQFVAARDLLSNCTGRMRVRSPLKRAGLEAAVLMQLRGGDVLDDGLVDLLLRGRRAHLRHDHAAAHVDAQRRRQLQVELRQRPGECIRHLFIDET